MDRNDAMASVHRRFAVSDAELSNGFAEHAPMGAEALLTLGVEPAAVHAWAERHEPVPTQPGSTLAVMREAVVAELATDDWRSVLRRRVTRLAPHVDAHLFHGLIRTAHAARALGVHDEPGARAELATALAAWDIWAGGSDAETARAARAMGDPLVEVVEYGRRGAGAFVSSPSIFTLHAVTAPMAYLLVAEHLGSDAHAAAAAAFARTHVAHPSPAPRTADRDPPTATELAPLVHRWDAHPAKLIEASVRGFAHSGDAVFLDAVAVMMAG